MTTVERRQLAEDCTQLGDTTDVLASISMELLPKQ
jgi:hypothetical protein